MQLQHLAYFVAVAEQGSINKAAETLFVTQPNLSKVIRNLESELKITIFERNNKGVTLTTEGKNLYQYACTIMKQMDLINGISGKEAPRILSISSYPIITMSRLMGEFYQANKETGVLLRLTEQRIQRVVESVESGEAELGFIMLNNVQTRELRHMLGYKNLELNLLGTDTWYINVGPKSPFYGREEVSIRELLDYPVVRMPDDYFSNLTFYLEIDGVKLAEFQKVVYMGDSAAILNMLRRTDVFRFGPGFSRGDFAEYGIQTIPIKNCDVEIHAGWIRRKKEILSDSAQRFVSLLEKAFQDESLA